MNQRDPQPNCRAQIRVDRKSTEREMAEDHPSMYLPSSEPRDRFSDAVKVALD